MMKRLLLLVLALHLYYFCPKAFGQVNQFPYIESFENETFTEGENLYFINNWFGNYVDNTRIFQENSNVRTGNSAIGLWPVVEEGEEEEEIEIFAQVNLDLTGLENVVTNFWVATVATAAMKHVKLYLKLSVDGGLTFGPKVLMGSDSRGFQNINTAYQEFTYAFHPNAFFNSDVVLQFMAKSGARNGTAAKILIDDITIYAAEEDIFPPIALEPKIINTNEIEIRFSEPMSPISALSTTNYRFIEAPTPLVTTAVLKEPDLVTLILDPSINIGKYYDLEITNIEDIAGNIMTTSIVELIYNPLIEGLVITEIMYDEPPAEQNDNLEFIELYNITDTPIELGGLRIKGGIASGKLPEFTLQPGDYWIIAKNATAFTSFFEVPAYEWMGANLSNDEAEMIYIQNTDHHSGVSIDSLTYTIGAPWPDGAAGLGFSMELIDPLADNSDPINWRNAIYYFGEYQGYEIYASPGTGPGNLNTEEEQLVEPIDVYPNPVKDILNIASKTELIKVEIYSLLGHKIKELRSGLNSIKTSNLSRGIYIVKIYSENNCTTLKMIKN